MFPVAFECSFYTDAFVHGSVTDTWESDRSGNNNSEYRFLLIEFYYRISRSKNFSEKMEELIRIANDTMSIREMLRNQNLFILKQNLSERDKQ